MLCVYLCLYVYVHRWWAGELGEDAVVWLITSKWAVAAKARCLYWVAAGRRCGPSRRFVAAVRLSVVSCRHARPPGPGSGWGRPVISPTGRRTGGPPPFLLGGPHPPPKKAPQKRAPPLGKRPGPPPRRRGGPPPVGRFSRSPRPRGRPGPRRPPAWQAVRPPRHGVLRLKRRKHHNSLGASTVRPAAVGRSTRRRSPGPRWLAGRVAQQIGIVGSDAWSRLVIVQGRPTKPPSGDSPQGRTKRG